MMWYQYLCHIIAEMSCVEKNSRS